MKISKDSNKNKVRVFAISGFITENELWKTSDGCDMVNQEAQIYLLKTYSPCIRGYAK